ncbi:MAG: hypothetical protein ACREPT_10540 [Rudaea sp.]
MNIWVKSLFLLLFLAVPAVSRGARLRTFAFGALDTRRFRRLTEKRAPCRMRHIPASKFLLTNPTIRLDPDWPRAAQPKKTYG